jgi:hypothetical protein
VTEPLTPIAVESKLRELVTSVTMAQRDLAGARDAETQAEITLKRSRVAAAHASDCPRVARGGATVADREAWIDKQCLDDWAHHRVATTAREIAQDRLRAVTTISEVVRSLGSSVRTAYSMAGAT